MPNYRRNYVPGGTYFFTVTLRHRPSTLLIDYIDPLRNAVRAVKAKHPFTINAWVVLPDHLHTIWTLPGGDADYPLRWRRIKSLFTRALPDRVRLPSRRKSKGERDVWQTRYWEHTVSSTTDLQRCFDYLHYNPVKHGYVQRVKEWPYSTFHRHVIKGVYNAEWGAGFDIDGDFGE